MPTDFNSQSAPDVDVDALLAQIEAPASQDGEIIPMTKPAEEPPAQPEPKPAPAPAAAQEYEFNWNGRQIKAPIDKILQYAQQGYNYAQRAQELNQREAQYKEWEQKYKPIDEYIQKDPQWWDHVQGSYQQRLAGMQAQQAQNTQVDPALAQEIQALKAQIQDVAQFKQSLVQEREAQRIQSEDQQLTQQIESIRKQYPDLDLSTVDESGKTLEMRVMEFGIQNGIRDFAAAFKVFNHDALLKRAEERGKELIQKDLQKKTKLGLLGTSPTPRRVFNEPEDLKNKSYEDLLRESIEELRGA